MNHRKYLNELQFDIQLWPGNDDDDNGHSKEVSSGVLLTLSGLAEQLANLPRALT